MMAVGAAGFATAMMLEHVLMLAAMLLRYEEYARGHDHAHAQVA